MCKATIKVALISIHLSPVAPVNLALNEQEAGLHFHIYREHSLPFVQTSNTIQSIRWEIEEWSIRRKKLTVLCFWECDGSKVQWGNKHPSAKYPKHSCRSATQKSIHPFASSSTRNCFEYRTWTNNLRADWITLKISLVKQHALLIGMTNAITGLLLISFVREQTMPHSPQDIRIISSKWNGHRSRCPSLRERPLAREQCSPA